MYIYTSVSSSIICTKQNGAEKMMMPITDEQEEVFFERQFRAQATNAPRGCGRERHFWTLHGCALELHF